MEPYYHDETMIEALLGLSIMVFLLSLILAVISAVSTWKIFEKAAQPGWAAIIPVYNILVLFKIIGKPWWWILLWLIPLLNLVWIIWSFNLLAKRFGMSEGFTVGLILLPFVFLPILGFGAARYIDPRHANELRHL